MKVHGVEITREQIAFAQSLMIGEFKAGLIASAFHKAGVPWTIRPATKWHDVHVAYEAANRLLQKERKAGRIRAVHNKLWERCA